MPGWSGAGGAVADFLSGNYRSDGIPAGWIWVWRGDWDVADVARDGRDGVYGPADAAVWVDVCDAGLGGVGGGIVRKFAEESDGAGYASGDLFYFADGDFEWADDYAAEFSDVGGEVTAGGAVDFAVGEGRSRWRGDRVPHLRRSGFFLFSVPGP